MAALPDGFGKNFTNSALQSRMIFHDDQLHAAQTAAKQAVQQLLPVRGAFLVCQFHGQYIAPPFPSMPMAIGAAWLSKGLSTE